MSLAFDEGALDVVKVLIRFNATHLPKFDLKVLASMIQKRDPNLTFLVASSSIDNFNTMRKAIGLDYGNKWRLWFPKKVRTFFDKPLSLKEQSRIIINQKCQDLNSLTLPKALKEYVKYDDF